MTSPNKVWPKILAIDLLMLCVSFSMSTVGQMRDKLEAAFALSAAEGGLLLSVQSIGGFAVTLIMIIFIDSFNKEKLIVLAGVLTGLFIVTIGIDQPLFTLFVVFILLGFFAGIVKTLVNAVMYETVSLRVETHMTLLHMLFSLGSVIAPIASYALYIGFGLMGVFLVLGGVSILFAVYGAFAFRQGLRKKMLSDRISVRYRWQELKKVLDKPGMKGIAFVSFMVSAWQVAATYCTASYGANVEGVDSHGATALSVLFLGMMVARLLYARIATRFSQIKVLTMGCALGFAAWIAMILVQDITIKIVLIGVSALCCGNNVPITYVVGCKIAPENSAAAAGIISFGYYFALFVFVPVVGLIGDSIGLGNALMIAALPLILLFPFTRDLYKKLQKA